MESRRRVRFGRYELIERLAVGGMAELYRASLTGPYGFTKTVAIKKILSDLSRDNHFRQMFLQESRIMAALNHRNLVQVFELGEVAGELFMCIELVNGCDLGRLLRHQRDHNRLVDPALAAWIAREICRGLEYVHTLRDDSGKPMSIVHRDVNPDNILVSRDGDVKLGDFGIAKSLAGEVLTRHGQVKGKLGYLSPEQARGDTVTGRSDLYAVGLVLYEILALERYVRGKGVLVLIQKATKPDWRPITQKRPDVSPDLEDILERALRVEPEERYASASALADALSQFIDRAARPPDRNDVCVWVAEVCDPQATAPQPKPKHSTESGREATPRPPPVARPLLDPAGDPAQGVGQLTASLPGAFVGNARSVRRNRTRSTVLWVGIAVLGITATVLLVRGLVVHNEIVPVPPAKFAVSAAPSPLPPQNPTNSAATMIAPYTKKEERPRENRKPPKTEKHITKADPAASPTDLKPPLSQNRVDTTQLGSELRTEEALKKELARQRLRLSERGVRSGDSSRIDGLASDVARRIASHDRQGAAEALHSLEVAVDSLTIDHRFIEQKILRLQKVLQRQVLESRYSSQIREILDHAINSRFVDANAAINRVLDQIGRSSGKSTNP